MFKVGTFSRITNTTVRTLHHYEKIGLLLPTHIDEQSNYRYYDAKLINKLNQIKVLQQIGFSLEEIKQILKEDVYDNVSTHFEQKYQALHQELEALKNKQKFLELLMEKDSEQLMSRYNISVRELPERNVMSIRRPLPEFDAEGLLWQELYEEFLAQEVTFSTPPFGISYYHDSEYKEENVDVEIQSSVIGEYADTDKVKFFTQEAEEIASVVFQGDFSQMPLITTALGNWISMNNYEIAGPMVNIPIVSPAQSPDSEDWIHEAGFIVKKIINQSSE
ncbi:MerR family transcriptional regulator [Vagococcus elongatus]|uniref:HTH merR-type domain-containing protein n=1 Tax=Vagococcus elongatus TaxID=180344 RepID=A0A430AZP0_9ENTE|nr:MerR family transcriptional regulator [Vagococcus elongatus]RSU13563.1 hypothetical protein CBF29_04740 [Vagococcus elongatus]